MIESSVHAGSARPDRPASRSIRPIALLVLLVLLVPAATRLHAAPPDAPVLSAREVADLRRQATEELSRAARAPKRGQSALEAAWQRADAEPDPVRREALLDAWLRHRVRMARESAAPASDVASSRLEALTRFRGVSSTRHHEHPEHVVPAFAVAALARTALEEERIRETAAKLGRDPDRLAAELTQPPRSIAFRAAIRALSDPELPERAFLLSDMRRRLPSEPAVGPALLELVRRRAIADHAVLVELVRHADPATANAAIRLGDSAEPDVRRRLIDAGLARPDIAGLAIARALRSDAGPSDGHEPDAFGDGQRNEHVWQLLDDDRQGADAALALARSDLPIEARIAAEFADAPPRMRLRMLLALKLRDTVTARALLDELLDDATTTPAERRATAAWR